MTSHHLEMRLTKWKETQPQSPFVPLAPCQIVMCLSAIALPQSSLVFVLSGSSLVAESNFVFLDSDLALPFLPCLLGSDL